jgi:hypothetical protein
MGPKFLARKIQLKRLGVDRYSWILPLSSLDFFDRLNVDAKVDNYSLSSICLINLTFDIFEFLITHQTGQQQIDSEQIVVKTIALLVTRSDDIGVPETKLNTG